MDINTNESKRVYTCPICTREYEKRDLMLHFLMDHDLTFNDLKEANQRLSAIGCPIKDPEDEDI